VVSKLGICRYFSWYAVFHLVFCYTTGWSLYYVNVPLILFYDSREAERDLIISNTLLRIRLFAEDPESVATSLYVCWMIPGDTLFDYQYECWTSSGEHFWYTGWHSWTLQIVLVTLIIDILLSVMVLIIYNTFLDISRKRRCGPECSRNFKKGICIGNMVVCVAVFIISIIYETQYNKTNPKIISYFFHSLLDFNCTLFSHSLQL